MRTSPSHAPKHAFLMLLTILARKWNYLMLLH